MNARGRLLTTQRRNNIARSSRSTDDEKNFGGSGYEVTTWHEDHAKIGNGTNKELHVLKHQLKE